MFDVEVRLTVGGRAVPLSGFVDALLQEVAKTAQSEVQKPPGARPLPAPVLTSEVLGAQNPKPLAVGVNEAGKLLGLSPWTIRRYIAEGQIRSVRIGRRVLVPMDVLEKVMLEGVGRR